MKKSLILLSAILLCLTAFTTADGAKIPSVNLKKADGTVINSNTFTNNGKPIILSFWATWCKPCKKELDAIALKYEAFQKETGVKLITVCVDDARTSARAIAELKTKGWLYESYLDEEKNLMKAMNINGVPYTALIDGNGNVVWTHDSYTDGDETALLENAKKLANGETLSH